MEYKTAVFDEFEIEMTTRQAKSCSHPGPCDADVASAVCATNIDRQLREIGPTKIRDELRQWGAWDKDELLDDEQNKARIVWIAAGNIADEV